jgi:hypothetical protein
MKEASITLAALEGGRLAVGFAKPDGTPTGAIAGADGRFAPVEARTKGYDALGKPAGKRWTLRVTPLAMDGDALRVGADTFELAGSARTYRCGPADHAPWMSTTMDGSIVDCRTFGGGGSAWVLATRFADKLVAWNVATGPTGLAAEAPTPAPKEPLILRSVILGISYDDHFGYQVPSVVPAGDAGFVLAARQDGGLVLARRDAKLDKGPAVRHAFGAPITTPALAAKDKTFAVFFGLFGKGEIYGAAYASDAADFAKPAKLAFEEKGDVQSFSAAYRPKGDVALGYVKKTEPKSRAMVLLLGPSLEPQGSPTDLGVDGVRELRVGALGDGRIVAVFTDEASTAVKSVVLACP